MRPCVRQRLCVGVLVGTLTLSPVLVSAQGIPVFDGANLVQNVITAVQAVFIVANQLLELAGVEGFALDDEYSETLDLLGEIVTEARGLSNDLASLQSQVTGLFHLDNAPRGSAAYAERMREIRRLVFECYLTAVRTQTLIRTIQSAVRHTKRLLEAIGDLVGNMQANQTLLQVEETISATLLKMQAQTAAYERAQATERLADNMTIEALHRINEAVMADHPE
jgi:conjugal transfer/entry exclusion protein